MKRRDLLKLLMLGGAAATLPWQPGPASARGAASAPWDRLRRQVGTRLTAVCSPLAECAKAGGAGAEALFTRAKNPYFLGDEPGLTQSFGWIDAWTTQASDYAVAAESAADVAAAVDFAQTHGVRLVVKGGGHSYLGNSNAADSLLVWTRRMRDITLHDTFRGEGWPASMPAVPAVSVGAGCLWGQVYDTVTKAGRYVQGGGCLTVGVGGFVLGGGFGSLSKQFGTGASNLLEAEIVTADGRVRVVNAAREPELFYALRGGGGGTFGVVTRFTMRTHPLPEAIGAVMFGVTANDDAGWRRLVDHAMQFYAETLFNPNWGEQYRFDGGRRFSVSMLCHGLAQAEMEKVWQPLIGWIRERPGDYTWRQEPVFLALPARNLWNPGFLKTLPGIVLADDRPGASPNNVYWATNRGEAGQVLHAYKSAWLPSALLRPDRRSSLVDAIVAAANEWTISFHFNKGLAGGSAEALAHAKEIATNPQVLDAFALLICAAEQDPAWPGIPGHEPDIAKGRQEAAAVARAFAHIRRLAPDAGSYMSESDYFEPDWKRSYWGENYSRLAAAKRRYDPQNLFRGRNCVEPG